MAYGFFEVVVVSACPNRALLPDAPPAHKSFRQTQIFILETCPNIPVDKISVFPDLGQNYRFLNRRELNKGFWGAVIRPGLFAFYQVKKYLKTARFESDKNLDRRKKLWFLVAKGQIWFSVLTTFSNGAGKLKSVRDDSDFMIAMGLRWLYPAFCASVIAMKKRRRLA